MSRNKVTIGERFGNWTVIREVPERSKNQSVQVLARCDCGTEKVIVYSALRSGHTLSCGCQKKAHISEKKTLDLTGRIFGQLRVIRMTDKLYTDGSHIWECICSCGRLCEVPSHLLLNGACSKCPTCGDQYRTDRRLEVITKYRTKSEKRIAKIFCEMKQRCYNPENGDYRNYGARGITIEVWTCPEDFVKWSLENGYADDLTIDRIDVNGPYAPWNCRWASALQQANNRRTTRWIDLPDYQMQMSAADCARLIGISRGKASKMSDIQLSITTQMILDNL